MVSLPELENPPRFVLITPKPPLAFLPLAITFSNNFVEPFIFTTAVVDPLWLRSSSDFVVDTLHRYYEEWSCLVEGGNVEQDRKLTNKATVSC